MVLVKEKDPKEQKNKNSIYLKISKKQEWF